MKKSEYLISFIIITGIIFLFYILMKSRYNYNQISDKDTIYLNKIISDTVINWKEKILYKQVKPKSIKVIKSDTVKIPKEVIISAENTDNKLKIISLNLKDSIFKEYDLPEINKDFKIKNTINGLMFETKKFQYSGIDIFTGVEYNFSNNKEKVNYIFGIESGIKIKDNYELSFAVQYRKGVNDYIGIMKFKYKL